MARARFLSVTNVKPGISAPFDPKCQLQSALNSSFVDFHNVNNPNFGSEHFRVTTVREPTSHFFSVFNFFYYKFDEDKDPRTTPNQCDIECFGRPFTDILDGKMKGTVLIESYSNRF